jgi:hypothetical protein
MGAVSGATADAAAGAEAAEAATGSAADAGAAAGGPTGTCSSAADGAASVGTSSIGRFGYTAKLALGLETLGVFGWGWWGLRWNVLGV